MDRWTRNTRLVHIATTLVVALTATSAIAGPPYLTDDPDPVESHHWELYLASQWEFVSREHADGSLPHLEANYGVRDGAMIHLLVPAALSVASSRRPTYGVGDAEVGANIRLFAERPGRPQIGTFPIITIATGSSDRGLGSGAVEVSLPVWLMKHAGQWTIDGGAGLHFSDGETEAEYGSFVQRAFNDAVSVGAEVFGTVPLDGSKTRTQFDVALLLDLSDTNHLLFSGGPSFGAVGGGQAYAAWLMTP